MERKYLADLLAWKSSEKRKPLVVWGARQVGKTYLLRDLFAKREFPRSHIYVDCKDDTRFTDFVLENPTVDETIAYLEARFNKKIDDKTLLVFDEAQECLPLLSMLKYFFDKHPEIPVILTGSMVRLRIKRTLQGKGRPPKDGKAKGWLYPIGAIEELNVYPLSFNEFLRNANPFLFSMLEETWKNEKGVTPAVHETAMAAFKLYLFLGGMPEPVDEYLSTHSLLDARNAKARVYSNYLGDMELYQASPESSIRSASAFKKVYELLGRESKDFSPSFVEKGSRIRDFRSPIDWLEEARVVYRAQCLKQRVGIPFPEDDESRFRIYLSDVGMLSHQGGTSVSEFLKGGSPSLLSAPLYENFVAGELASRGIPLRYWKGKSSGEFEFMLVDGDSIVPVDVKRKRGKLTSLDVYSSQNPYGYALKVSESRYGYEPERRILSIPFYLLGFYLDDLVERNSDLSELEKELSKGLEPPSGN